MCLHPEHARHIRGVNNTYMVASSLLSFFTPGRCWGTAHSLSKFLREKRPAALSNSAYKGKYVLGSWRGGGGGEAFSCNTRWSGHGGGGVRAEVKLCQGCEHVGEKFCGATSLQAFVCLCRWGPSCQSDPVLSPP